MAITDVSHQYDLDTEPSKQRVLQRKLEQPMEIFFSKNYSVPTDYNSSLTTALDIDNSLLSYIHHQMELKPTFFNETEEAEKTAIIRQGLTRGDIPGFPKWESFV
jgi:hypothetical protein